jgi:hypothetical protein
LSVEFQHRLSLGLIEDAYRIGAPCCRAMKGI